MDTVIGHAGGCGLHPFATTSEAEYERIFRFNYFAQTYLARAVLDVLDATQDCRPPDLHIFLCGSHAAYANPCLLSAKRHWRTLPVAWLWIYALTGIRVNVVSPGNVAAGSSLKVFDEDPAYREFVLRVSLGRRNSPQSIADAFVFLCSPLAARNQRASPQP